MPSDAIQNALQFLKAQQQANGCVVGEVVWCPMITAQYVIVSRAIGRDLSAKRQGAILRYFLGEQRADGGWGMHPASESFVFSTALVYVALRMLGLPPTDARCERALAWLKAHGGVTHIPTWGKLWLWLTNLYDRAGVPPMLPELWLLPTSLPVHPSKMYCHTRMIYMAMSYLYGANVQCEADELILALRDELYGPAQFERIAWSSQREALAPTDLYARPSPLLRAFYAASGIYDAHAPALWRRLALIEALEQITYHQRHSNQAAISPVNGLLNVLALNHADHPDTQAAYDGMDHWIWEDDAGLRLCGAFSNTWDTAFAVQALIEGEVADTEVFLEGATRFLVGAQMKGELPAFERFFRDPAQGGFCFSDGYHRWPVSDCTAEAVSALCMSEHTNKGAFLGDRALVDGVRFMLLRQNPEGGWGSYEKRRGPLWLEQLNPSEMFAQCMVEHSYVECTASCIQALRHALDTRRVPATLVQEVLDSVASGRLFLLKSQSADGSWPGFWGVHHTYGTMFGVLGLRAAGDPPSDPAIERARAWLLRTQRPDGSWADSWRGCLEGRRIEASEGEPIQTAWAMIGLMRASDPKSGDLVLQEALDRGAEWLVKCQLPSGTWPRQQVSGVFFATAMLHYDLYKTYFPLWALALYAKHRA